MKGRAVGGGGAGVGEERANSGWEGREGGSLTRGGRGVGRGRLSE